MPDVPRSMPIATPVICCPLSRDIDGQAAGAGKQAAEIDGRPAMPFSPGTLTPVQRRINAVLKNPLVMPGNPRHYRITKKSSHSDHLG
jgi:hypothetical protein